MFKRRLEKIEKRLFKIEIEHFKLANPPKFKIGEEVIVFPYGKPERKKITHIEIMSFKPEWCYSFGVSQDWTVETDILSINEFKNV